MSQSHQHAPSPDYSIAGDLTPVTITCRDCGDVEMQFTSNVAGTIQRMRCDECEEQRSDEAATFFRAHETAIKKALAHPIYLHKSGGMNDERTILCDECGGEAMSHSGSVDPLDGKAGICEDCQTVGKVVVDQDDEGRVYARFRSYTTKELDGLAAEGKACTECLTLGAVNSDGICNECDEHAERRSMGW